MNKFEPVSQAEYNKVVTEEFTAKNGVIDYQSYEQLQIPKRATKGSAGLNTFRLVVAYSCVNDVF